MFFLIWQSTKTLMHCIRMLVMQWIYCQRAIYPDNVWPLFFIACQQVSKKADNSDRFVETPHGRLWGQGYYNLTDWPRELTSLNQGSRWSSSRNEVTILQKNSSEYQMTVACTILYHNINISQLEWTWYSRYYNICGLLKLSTLTWYAYFTILTCI